ncbi:peptidylprolyl isomerase [Paenibacillus camerounensis]|uniref:peptidylprolyl isomerase n=1 Tax=Paenibacillus camerounensis TaxID=1243663 RepID=UPI0005A8E02E|nr:peptidylprolyl isomerase [Paenibacillus camerounensis]
MKRAAITLEKGQVIELELYEQEAPGTVANFEKLANSGFYNGLAFQRVVRNFVAQGGCPEGTGRGGTEKIPCETQNNPHKHVRGALSMAHFGPNTGSCQFFICYDAFDYLDPWHTVFGGVTAGMEHVDTLRRGDVIREISVWARECHQE